MDDSGNITKRFELLARFFDERDMRLFVAAEAECIGRGGVSEVSRATGVSRVRVAQGLKEIRGEVALPKGRTRREGGGRKSLLQTDPTLGPDLEALVEASTRGDPESPLMWTCKSLRNLSKELSAKGHKVGRDTVAQILHKKGYSLQANTKTLEGSAHQDRDAQFRHISATAKRFLAAGEPVISVDTKKKELVGRFKNQGREYRRKGQPEEVRVHDFVDPEQGKAIPYGVYDVGKNSAWVSVGTDHDTSCFAVESIRRWWCSMGRDSYPVAKELLITADSGGSNGSRVRLWKVELQKLADELDMLISVCHLPPGTSKWNKIEHRLFSFITQNWRGKPLISHEVIVNLIAATTTSKGLQVRCALDRNVYPIGIKVSDKQLKCISISKDDFHAEWNYTIKPRSP